MAHYRLTVKGTTPGEQFNFGVHASGTAGDAAGAAAALVTATTAMWNDATDGLTTHYTSDVAIVAAHAAELSDLNGRQVDAHEVAMTLAGTAASVMLPYQVSVAVTTRGAAATRKDRGRFYLPPPAISQVAVGKLSSANAIHFVNAAAIWINSLQGAGFNPVILHPDFTDTSIVLVDVGEVFDNQRRRRNKLVEARHSVGV
jgi:hypothetical protein